MYRESMINRAWFTQHRVTNVQLCNFIKQICNMTIIPYKNESFELKGNWHLRLLMNSVVASCSNGINLRIVVAQSHLDGTIWVAFVKTRTRPYCTQYCAVLCCMEVRKVAPV